MALNKISLAQCSVTMSITTGNCQQKPTTGIEEKMHMMWACLSNHAVQLGELSCLLFSEVFVRICSPGLCSMAKDQPFAKIAYMAKGWSFAMLQNSWSSRLPLSTLVPGYNSELTQPDLPQHSIQVCCS
jgi:hypothetical protein